jgi:hypothetical protein
VSADLAVPFRFEIPNWVWAADGDDRCHHLLDIFCEPGAFVEISETPAPFDRDVSILVGRADRAVLAELGPLVEACWRPVSGDQEGTSG